MPNERRTERLLLRQPVFSDLSFLVDLFSRPEMVAHRPNAVPDTAEQSRERLARDIEHWRRHGFGRWAVETDGRLIGFGGVTRSTDFGGGNLSYHLHPQSWGRGYASELAAEAVAFAFGSLGMRKVVGLARPANPASRRVLERAGLVFERAVELHGAPTMLFVLER